MHPASAIASVTHEYMHLFGAMKDPYMREKEVDIEDLGKRLIENLLSLDGDTVDYQEGLSFLSTFILRISSASFPRDCRIISIGGV